MTEILYRSHLAAACAASVVLVLSGCPTAKDGQRGGKSSQVLRSNKPTVVTTTGMIADMATRLIGDDATVVSLMGSGIDPHLYKATASDLRRLLEADLIIYNGLHLEGKMTTILHKLRAKGRAFPIGDALPVDKLRKTGATVDPHIWFDVSMWSQTVDPLAKRLTQLLPKRRAELAKRAAALKHDLARLDAFALSSMKSVPQAKRVLVTAHDAFGYFGRRYGVEVVGLQGLSTVTQAGVRDVDRVAKMIAARKVPAVFFESSVPKKTVEAVTRACRKLGHPVRVGGELFSDAMGAPGSPEGTYDGMVRHNVTTIVTGLTAASK